MTNWEERFDKIWGGPELGCPDCWSCTCDGGDDGVLKAFIAAELKRQAEEMIEVFDEYVDAVVDNPRLKNVSKELIEELRQHYLTEEDDS